MTSLDIGQGVRTALTRLRAGWEWYNALPPVRRVNNALGQVRDGWRRLSRWLNSVMPKGLYARALLIIIAPMVILQSVIAFVFMERHWNLVTQRLSADVVHDIAALIDVNKIYPQDADRTQLRKIAQDRLGLVVDFLPMGDVPPPGPKPFFSLLDQALSEELRKVGRPFWIDTVGKSSLVEIRVQLDNTVMRIFARRNAAYASNSEIFLLWMVGTSTVLLIVAIIFLRNQIKPILKLADAAESFGKGRDVPNFRPRGAREVRRAAQAFIEMKTRVERAMEQRTAMLAGVSHDLRTVLTRFKLELALIEGSPETEPMKKDVDEMARMLEAYLAFARAARPEIRRIAAFAESLGSVGELEDRLDLVAQEDDGDEQQHRRGADHPQQEDFRIRRVGGVATRIDAHDGIVELNTNFDQRRLADGVDPVRPRDLLA